MTPPTETPQPIRIEKPQPSLSLRLVLTDMPDGEDSIGYWTPQPDDLPLVARACLDAMTEEQRREARTTVLGQLESLSAMTAEQSKELTSLRADLDREKEKLRRATAERDEARRSFDKREELVRELHRQLDAANVDGSPLFVEDRLRLLVADLAQERQAWVKAEEELEAEREQVRNVTAEWNLARSNYCDQLATREKELLRVVGSRDTAAAESARLREEVARVTKDLEASMAAHVRASGDMTELKARAEKAEADKAAVDTAYVAELAENQDLRAKLAAAEARIALGIEAATLKSGELLMAPSEDALIDAILSVVQRCHIAEATNGELHTRLSEVDGARDRVLDHARDIARQLEKRLATAIRQRDEAVLTVEAMRPVVAQAVSFVDSWNSEDHENGFDFSREEEALVTAVDEYRKAAPPAETAPQTEGEHNV